jgi:hypothetical protein
MVASRSAGPWEAMVTFDIRIEFYRAPRSAPPTPSADAYVGAVTRQGLTSPALPRPGDYIHGLGPLASQTLSERGEVHHIEHFPIPDWDGHAAEAGVTAVIHATWPSDVRGRALLEEYAAKGRHVRLAGQNATEDA